jgi:hypothetical protein
MGFRTSRFWFPAIPLSCHPNYRALTFALAGLSPAEHTSLTWLQLPDGRISRVRLATMTVPVRSSPPRRGLSAHSHAPRARKVYRAARQSCVIPFTPAQSPAWATPRLPVMTESPFAPLRCYLLSSRVVHDLGQHYPAFTAPTGSCVEARSSVSLCHRL